MRLVLRRAYGGKETVLGEDRRGREGHGDASRAALRRRLGLRPRDVRALEPYFEHVAGGGTLDVRMPLRAGVGEDDAHHRRRASPAEFRRLEGAGKVGERYVGMVGIRDPYTIRNVDQVIEWARAKVRERRGRLRALLPCMDATASWASSSRSRTGRRTSFCILVQGVAPSAEMAEEVCMTGTRQMFMRGLPDVKGSAGGVAFALDEVLRASPAHRWTINHTLRCEHRWSFRTEMSGSGMKLAAREDGAQHAGVDLITFDIIFAAASRTSSKCRRSRARRWRSSTASRPSASSTSSSSIPPSPSNHHHTLRPSGSPGDPDIFGSQQYAPLLDLEVPD